MILYCYYSLTPIEDADVPSDGGLKRCIEDHFLEPFKPTFNRLKDREKLTLNASSEMLFGTIDVLITNYLPEKQKLEPYNHMFNADSKT